MASLSPHNRWRLAQILPFGIIWMVFGGVFLFADVSMLDSLGGAPGKSTAVVVSLSVALFAIPVTGVAGCAVGMLELFVVRKWLASRSFLQATVIKLFVYIAIFEFLILVFFPLAKALELKVSPLDTTVADAFVAFMGSLAYWNTILQLGVSLLCSLFYAEMSDSLGYQSMHRLLLGRYHQPVVEQRIFMFADMRGSTTIAEQLGHQRYFSLLNNFYSDLSQAVISFGGEVYQYVGDELVLTWQLSDSKTNGRCIACFHAMQQALTYAAPRYLEQYGVAPTFKAALHCGTVTAGEIGVLKRDILFTGDVLNATARIQAKCNALLSDLLLSDELLQQLVPEARAGFTHVGVVELRGRTAPLELYALPG